MTYKLNLLPHELRKSKKIDPKDFIVKSAIYASIAGLIIVELVFGWMLWSVKKQTTKLQAEISSIENAVQEVKVLKDANQAAKAKLEVFEKLSPKSSKWSVLLDNIALAMPGNVWLTHLAVDDKNNFILEGQADKLTTLGTFMQGLRSIDSLKSVSLTAATESLDGVKFTLSVVRGE